MRQSRPFTPRSVCEFFCFFFFFFLYTTETLNKAQREEVCEKKSGKLKSRTQTRAHKTPSLSLSLSYSLTLIKVHDRLKSSRPWYDFATATTTVYPSCGRLFSFERCDWITPSSSLLCRRFRPLIVPLDLSSSFKSVSPVSLSLSLFQTTTTTQTTTQKRKQKQAKPANAAMLQLIVGFLVGAVFVSIFSGSGSNYSVRFWVFFGRSLLFFHREKRGLFFLLINRRI